MDDIVIGIDLGTTNSCAAFFKNGIVEVLENSDGKRLTPSCVFFQKDSKSLPLVGQFARKMSVITPSNGIYEIKRFVGRSFEEVEKNLQYYPFTVINNNGYPLLEIEQDNKPLEKSPLDVTALILAKIKNDVDNKFGHPITKAVITVPAYFNSAQREVTLCAANKAGFTVLKLFNEPTAAALSYYFRNDDDAEYYSLVYDLGGGTFDVSILKKTSSSIDIICVGGDTNLGGKEFDNLIIDYVCDELTIRYKYDPKKDRRVMRRLQNKCEEAKIELSTTNKTVIILEGFVLNEAMVTINLTREQFEARANTLFEKTIFIVEKCLKDSKISKDQIKHIILAGGSSRIPKIQQMLSDFFNGKKLTKFVNFDECVAEGAALQAALLSENPQQSIKKVKITDVTRLSIGIADFVDRMEVIIPKNSAIPVSKSKTFFTMKDNPTICEFQIYEGERLNVAKNYHICTLILEDLTPAPPGDCEICVTLTINSDGILTVKASEHLNDNVKEISVKYIPGSKNDIEIANVIADAADHEKEDIRFEEFTEKKKYLLKYCQAIHFNLRSLDLKDKYNLIYKYCEETFDKRNTLTVDGDKALEEILNEIKKMCEPLFELYSFTFMPTLPCSLKKLI